MSRRENPLDQSSADPIVRFARDLRALRQRAGNPPYRTLVGVAGFSVSTLAQAAGGRVFPTLAVTSAYVRACGGDAAEWERRWHGVAAALSDEEPEPPAGTELASPYVGLAAYGPDDAALFFGRDALIEELLTLVERRRFVAVFGASGIGKSSLLRAGLMARMNRSDIVLCTPGTHPRLEFAESGDQLVVVDQFEELFTQCTDQTERQEFIAALAVAATDPDRRIHVVIGVRTDFYDRCAQDLELAELVRQGQFLVGPMTADQLRSVIIQPATTAGATVETALLTTLVAECAGRPGVLPLLSHALRETWRRRRGMALTLSGYQATGGIAHALAWTAERAYALGTADEQRAMKDVFLRLIVLGEGTEDTKRRLDRDELATAGPPTVAVLDRLVQARLITVDDGHAEITHEALIHNWPRLQEWLNDNRDGLRIHRGLSIAAQEWEALNRDDDLLYRGTRLDTAQDWAANGALLTTRERDFLTRSGHARQRTRAVDQRRTRRLRVLVAVLTVLVTLAGVLAIVARTEQRSALRQQNAATAQRVLAQATVLLATDPGEAEQLALAAYREAPDEQTASGLLNTAAAVQMRRTPVSGRILAISPGGGLLATTGRNRTLVLSTLDEGRIKRISTLSGLDFHADAYDTGTFSPDGRILMIGGYVFDRVRTELLWDITNPAEPTPLGIVSTSCANGCVPDAEFIDDHHIELDQVQWDISNPRNPIRLSAPPRVCGVHFADGVTVACHGTLIATLPADGAQLWDAADPEHLTPIATLHSPTPSSGDSLTFSADGTRLAMVDRNGSADIWDVTTPTRAVRLVTVTGYPDDKDHIAFSADDRTLITGDANAVQWFDLPPTNFTNTSAFNFIEPEFSPDARTMTTQATTSSGNPITNLWLIDQPGPPIALGGLNSTTGTTTTPGPEPDYGVGQSAAPFSDDNLLITVGTGTVRLWNITDIHHPRPLSAIVPDPSLLPRRIDGQVVLPSAGWDNSDPAAPRLDTRLDVAVSPDGRILVAQGKLWNISDPRHPRWVGKPFATGFAYPEFTISPNDTAVAVVGQNHAALYNLADINRPILSATLPNDTVSATFAANGTLLVVGRRDRPTEIWNVAEHRKLADIPNSRDAAAASQNTALVAIHDPTDNTVQIWDVSDPGQPTLNAALTGITRPLALDPTGHQLAAIATDGTLQLRQTNLPNVIAQICATTRQLDRTTWNQYLPEDPYQSTCG